MAHLANEVEMQMVGSSTSAVDMCGARNRYEVLRDPHCPDGNRPVLVGEGAFAHVVVARCTRTGALKALKSPRTGNVQRTAARAAAANAALMREYEASLKLRDCPNVLATEACFADSDGQTVLAMPLCAGGDLHSFAAAAAAAARVALGKGADSNQERPGSATSPRDGGFVHPACRAVVAAEAAKPARMALGKGVTAWCEPDPSAWPSHSKSTNCCLEREAAPVSVHYDAAAAAGRLGSAAAAAAAAAAETGSTPPGRLSELEALQLLLPMASGAAQMHERGYAHLDIKPENALRTRAENVGSSCCQIGSVGTDKVDVGDGKAVGATKALRGRGGPTPSRSASLTDGWSVVLADLGCSRRIRSATLLAEVELGSICAAAAAAARAADAAERADWEDIGRLGGTPGYMAPEVVLANRNFAEAGGGGEEACGLQAAHAHPSREPDGPTSRVDGDAVPVGPGPATGWAMARHGAEPLEASGGAHLRQALCLSPSMRGALKKTGPWEEKEVKAGAAEGSAVVWPVEQFQVAGGEAAAEGCSRLFVAAEASELAGQCEASEGPEESEGPGPSPAEGSALWNEGALVTNEAIGVAAAADFREPAATEAQAGAGRGTMTGAGAGAGLGRGAESTGGIQASGVGHNVGSAADVWSLGACLYFFVTGLLPYREGAAQEDEEWETPELQCLAQDPEGWSGLSEGTRDLICRMLDPNPDLRSSAGDLLEELPGLIEAAAAAASAAAAAEGLQSGRGAEGRRRGGPLGALGAACGHAARRVVGLLGVVLRRRLVRGVAVGVAVVAAAALRRRESRESITGKGRAV